MSSVPVCWVEMSRAQTEGLARRQQSVRDHHQHRAGDADQVQACNAQKNKTHVRHAGIADQPD